MDRSARLAIALISDFCEALGLNATRSVLSHETGLSSDEVTYISKPELASSVGEDPSNKGSGPSSILVRLVSSVSNDVVIGGRGSTSDRTSEHPQSGKSIASNGSNHKFGGGNGISKVLGLGASVNRLVLSTLDTSAEERSNISDPLSTSGIKSPNALSDAEDRSPVAPIQPSLSSSRIGTTMNNGRQFPIQTVVPSLADTMRPTSSRGRQSSLSSIIEKGESPKKRGSSGRGGEIIAEEDYEDDFATSTVRLGGASTYSNGNVVHIQETGEEDFDEGEGVGDSAEVDLSGEDRSR